MERCENDLEYEIEYFGKGWGSNHDLYISSTNGFNRPYFIQTPTIRFRRANGKNKLMIIKTSQPLYFDDIDASYSVTTCIKQ